MITGIHGGRFMNYLDQLNEALQYIEKNLDSQIDYEELASITGYSVVYFQRIFSLLTDSTLAEYIRRRRMTLAARDLRESNERILDIALRYGYESADAFSRAFQQLHGINPSAARKDGARVKAYPPLTFHIAIQGDKELNYRIENKEEMRIVGLKRRFQQPGDSPESVNTFWNEVYDDGSYDILRSLSMGQPRGVHGFMLVIDEDTVEYTIAVVSDEIPPIGMQAFTVDEACFAIFEVVGPLWEQMPVIWRRIFAEWLPTSGYCHAQTTEIECFTNPGDKQAQDFTFEIWIPICR